MTMGELLRIQPSDLKFPFEVRKQSVCAMQLANKTDQYVAFKVKTTNPKRYCVRPNAGVVLPYSVCNVTVTMQAPKEAPPDMQCRDKFLVQSVIVPIGTTNKDINQEMFNRDNGKFVDEFKLRVVFIPANPPSPVPEEDEEGNSPGTSSADDENRKFETVSVANENRKSETVNVANENRKSETVARSFKPTIRNAPDSEAWSDISKLKDEKATAAKQSEKLLSELELVRKQTGLQRRGGSSIVVLLFGLIIGIFIGYFISK